MTTFLEYIIWDNKIAIGLRVQNYTMKMKDERKKQKLSLKKVIRGREFNFGSSTEDTHSQKTRTGVDWISKV